MYKIDFRILIQMLIPSLIKKPRLTALLVVLFFPFKLIWDKFTTFRKFTQLQLNCTGQVIYLERLLNLMFNNGNSGITIVDGSFTIRFYLSNKNEGFEAVYFTNKSEDIEAIYLQNKSDFFYDFDFLVQIPTSINLTELDKNRLIAIVQKYAIAGKTFNIISYEQTKNRH